MMEQKKYFKELDELEKEYFYARPACQQSIADYQVRVPQKAYSSPPGGCDAVTFNMSKQTPMAVLLTPQQRALQPPLQCLRKPLCQPL